jgi:hypothetical protein
MRLKPVLFSSDQSFVEGLAGPGAPADGRVERVVVDWENHGKGERQREASCRIGTDTQISTDTPADLRRVVGISTVPVSCRLNSWSETSRDELELAIALGASEVLLPMVRSVEEVEHALAVADERVDVGILIETEEAVGLARQLSGLTVSRVYVGLMDLALERGTSSIFEALVDGTVERVRHEVDVPFGVGGLTLPGCGHPVPAEILTAELVRLECDFSFMRRSFMRDCCEDPAKGLRAISAMVERLEARDGRTVAADRIRLESMVTTALAS